MRWIWGWGIVLGLAGCGVERVGQAAQYRSEAPEPIEVSMPPDATYISQQFLVSRTTTDRHEGIDLWGVRGTPVLAAAPGIVQASWWEPIYGNRVRIDHGIDAQGRRVFTRYFHLESRSVEVGRRLARGEVLG
ncbi:MAG: M23 family metallopeptidase, partial [Boseongicola sp.]|nr:M23 family metallopeptidase [Boseongicola sp.]